MQGVPSHQLPRKEIGDVTVTQQHVSAEVLHSFSQVPTWNACPEIPALHDVLHMNYRMYSVGVPKFPVQQIPTVLYVSP